MTGRYGAVVLCFGLLVTIACSSPGPHVYRVWNGYTMVAPIESSQLSYRDETIKVRFWIGEKKIHFAMQNLSETNMVIDWKRATFLNIDNTSHQIANAASMFGKHRTDPAPTIIKAGETLTESVTPVENIEKLEEWTWYIYPLFNLMDEGAYDNKGKVFGIDLPISTGDIDKTYSFRFKIAHVQPYVRS